MLNWGMPSPPERMMGKADYGTTNLRRRNFGHWRQMAGDRTSLRRTGDKLRRAEHNCRRQGPDNWHLAELLVRARRDEANSDRRTERSVENFST